MDIATQLNLFEQKKQGETDNSTAEWGTFKDSLKAPVHRWFTYPAGFSYRAVEYSFQRFGIEAGQTVYDPFMGSGTTNLTAKTLGMDSFGVEAHPFVYKLACAKLNWAICREKVDTVIASIQREFVDKVSRLQKRSLADEFPDLILRCYDDDMLYDLWALRDLTLEKNLESDLQQFFFVVLTALLRQVSTAATGWPYIAPKKLKSSSLNKDVLTEFIILSKSMCLDIDKIKSVSGQRHLRTVHTLIQGDARDTCQQIQPLSVDHVFTSPPYLNNFDYADRTRLELYFWGEAKSWGDISANIRTKLMTSATTQISRSDTKYQIAEDFATECTDVATFVRDSMNELAIRRKTKGGKKSYDLLVSGYFNDIYRVIKDVYRVLKPNTKAIFVLGDSAPYGVHIPTDELIGKIALGVGFSNYSTEVLRIRGGKWKQNPQRHSVKLRESIVILEKE